MLEFSVLHWKILKLTVKNSLRVTLKLYFTIKKKKFITEIQNSAIELNRISYNDILNS